MSGEITLLQAHAEQDADALAVAQALAEPAAFGILYERYGVRVYRYLRAKTASDEEAADLTQTVFLRAFASLRGYRSNRAPFVAWLFRIARNVSIDAHRRRQRAVAGEASGWLRPSSEFLDPVEMAIRRERLDRLRLLLADLDPSKRDLLMLRFSAGLSSAEIAAIVGKSEAAVKKQLTRIIAALKEHYHDDRS
jgi:RNA polymerase sigma-70 factor (ECF subfamily)